jgi:hypothetical protein
MSNMTLRYSILLLKASFFRAIASRLGAVGTLLLSLPS